MSCSHPISTFAQPHLLRLKSKFLRKFMRKIIGYASALVFALSPFYGQECLAAGVELSAISMDKSSGDRAELATPQTLPEVLQDLVLSQDGARVESVRVGGVLWQANYQDGVLKSIQSDSLVLRVRLLAGTENSSPVLVVDDAE
jgi:hypothetical protein